jgi:hypothetical protein
LLTTTITDLQTGQTKTVEELFSSSGGGLEGVVSVVTPTSVNLVSGADFNLYPSNFSASTILNGNNTQPNISGKECTTEDFIGNGAQTNFLVVSPFPVNNITRKTVQVITIRASDGASVIQEEGGDFTVSGYSTSTITIDMASPVPSGDTLRVVLFGENDDSGAVSSLQTITGYDNIVNPIMTNVLAAHCYVPNGAGHNSLLGGSFHQVFGSFSTVLNGKTNTIGKNNAGTVGAGAGGQNCSVDGSFSFAYGESVYVSGTKTVAFGRGHNIVHDECFVTGDSGESRSDGERIHSLEAGAQIRTAICQRETTNATVTSLSWSGGASSIGIPEDSSSVLKVTASAKNDTHTKFAAWSGEFLLTKTGGVGRINNSTGDVNLALISSIGSPTWNVAARVLGGNLVIRVTGEVSENISWIGSVDITEVVY